MATLDTTLNYVLEAEATLGTPGGTTNYRKGQVVTGSVAAALFAAGVPLVAQSSGLTAPTIVAGTGAGTSPTIAISGSQNGQKITLTTGSSPATSATIATVTLPAALGNNIIAVMSPGGANSAGLAVGAVPFISATTTSTYTITSGGTALTAATAYTWYVITRE